jgi:hypothetical protein
MTTLCLAVREPEPPAAPPLPSPLDSLIISSLPPPLAEFRGKRFVLLCRGSRDGFGVQDFHGRCDRRASTLTLILDTGGNVFGGFTPLQWESRVWNGKHDDANNLNKRDDSLKSFIFTLKNPHNRPARKFALKAEKKQCAINCWSLRGPALGYGPPDLSIAGNCNANTDGDTKGFGQTYTNDTGLDGKTLFTGSVKFTVREIEVFEITDSTILPSKSCSPACHRTCGSCALPARAKPPKTLQFVPRMSVNVFT